MQGGVSGGAGRCEEVCGEVWIEHVDLFAPTLAQPLQPGRFQSSGGGWPCRQVGEVNMTARVRAWQGVRCV